jgi:lipopolysaccharide export system protein LptC
MTVVAKVEPQAPNVSAEAPHAARRGRSLRPARLARRRQAVQVAKFALPVIALALLSSIALWPEISRTIERGRQTWKRLTMVNVATGEMKDPRYRGFDDQNQPYMVTATSADRLGPEKFNLHNPRGDLTMRNGQWVQVQAKHGVYVQHVKQLDLSQDVTLYRADGTIMTSATATIDVQRGAVSSSDYTHAEGPFGTLDAEGFTLVDKGGIMQFHGPAKLVLNAAN